MEDRQRGECVREEGERERYKKRLLGGDEKKEREDILVECGSGEDGHVGEGEFEGWLLDKERSSGGGSAVSNYTHDIYI
jgi:hypothetical protein